MISVHAVPFARDQGVSLAGASLALTAYGIGSAIGRLLGGTLSDRLGPRATIAAAFLLQIPALGHPAAGSPRAPALLLASLVAFGAGFASTDTVVAKVVPEVFGMRALGAIMGDSDARLAVRRRLGPALAGFLYDLTGLLPDPLRAGPAGDLAELGPLLLATSRPGRPERARP